VISYLNVATETFSRSLFAVGIVAFYHISLNCGDSKGSVVTKVANVATETI
jgi:hypothetical protein